MLPLFQILSQPLSFRVDPPTINVTKGQGQRKHRAVWNLLSDLIYPGPAASTPVPPAEAHPSSILPAIPKPTGCRGAFSGEELGDAT